MLHQVRAGDYRQYVVEHGLNQQFLGECAAVIYLTMIFQRMRFKYGERSYRYGLVEAGHLGQNLYLAATSLGLGRVRGRRVRRPRDQRAADDRRRRGGVRLPAQPGSGLRPLGVTGPAAGRIESVAGAWSAAAQSARSERLRSPPGSVPAVDHALRHPSAACRVTE